MDAETLQRMQRDYVEDRILSAHPVEIVAMLFQVTIDSLNSAIEHLKTREHLARSRDVTRAEQAVQELLLSLNHSVDPSFSSTSAGLYRYVLQRIVAGHAQQSEKAFREALSVLIPLASAWVDVKVRMTGEPQTPEVAIEPEPEQSHAPANESYSAYCQDAAVPVSRDWSC